MGVPDFQSFLLPMLRFAGDGKEHSLPEALAHLASDFKLTSAEQDERLPSGLQSRFANRVAWARVYLKQAGLLLSPGRGHFVISERGREVLKTPPARIDIKFLQQYPEFIEFQTPKNKGEEAAAPAVAHASDLETPEEALEAAHAKMKASLASEVLARVKAASPEFFEKLVVELLLKMGYGGSRADAGQAVGKAGDEGIDGVISEDRLGLDIVYLQAKRWDGSVGRPEIQKFVGALHGKRAKKGVFITSGSFSAEAAAYVERIDPKVVLIDGRRLAELMVDFEVGVTTARTYHVKRVDVEGRDSASPQQLDSLLRRVWLECCGHMSAFRLGRAEFSKRAPLGALQPKGIAFQYEYDFGSTTALRGKVLGHREGSLGRNVVRVLARNTPLKLTCASCGAPATLVCPFCISSGPCLFCEAHAPEHPCAEEDVFMPAVNSPRMGVCGCTG